MKQRKSQETVRNKKFEAWFSQTEYATFRSKAQACGLSLAEFMRRCALRRSLPVQFAPVTIEMYRELGRIGNNLNQLVKAVNTSLKAGLQPPAAAEELVKLNKLLDQYRYDLVNRGFSSKQGR